MQAARGLVHIGVELAAGVERAHDDFEGGLLGKFRVRVDRNAAAIVGDGEGRQYDRRAMRDHECIRHDDKAASRLAPKGDDGRFDFYVAMNGRNDWHDLE